MMSMFSACAPAATVARPALGRAVLHPACAVRRMPGRPTAGARDIFSERRERSSAACASNSKGSAILGWLPEWLTKAAKVLGALAVAVALILSTPSVAEAARSGGRMGGSSFSSGRSFSSPSTSAGSGSRVSNSYSGYRSAPRTSTTIVTPAPSFGIGFPLFGYGYPIYSGGSSLFSLLVLGIFAYLAYNTIASSFGRDDEEDDYIEEGREPMSVVKLQVGLLGSARELQRDLNRMANSLDTSTPRGLHVLLQETVLALRRNPQYAVYGKAELQKTRGLDNAEARFNQMSMEERGKFQRETLSNFGGRTSRSVAQVTGDGINELIVITIIAAVDGKVEPTDIQDEASLRDNLGLLGSVPADRLLALEVLWTPQDEGDYFTKDELITDYPTMNML